MQSETRSPSRPFVRVVQQCAVTESHRQKASALSAEATECIQQPQAQAVFVQFLSDIVLIDGLTDWNNSMGLTSDWRRCASRGIISTVH